MTNQPWILGDENGNLPPEGTVVEFPSQFDHQAIIAYTEWGEQVLLEKTLLRGGPTVTNPEEYRGVTHVIARRPNSQQHGVLIVRRSIAEVEAGKPWTIFDNCQDFVSRAYDGKSGSKTRSACFGVAALLGLVGIAAASSQ